MNPTARTRKTVRYVRRARRSKIQPSLLLVGVLVVVIAGWVGWNAWQSAQTPAAPGVVAIVTNAPLVGQPQVDVSTAGVTPIPPADIRGNIAQGQPAPDFTVRTMGGGTFALTEHKPTLMLFMASWCGSCIYEAQNLARVHQLYKDKGLSVVALNVQPGDTDAELGQFRQAAGNPDYVWAFDDNYSVAQAYNVRSLDTTVLIDQSGKIVYEDQYPTPLEPLLQAVMAVLPAK